MTVNMIHWITQLTINHFVTFKLLNRLSKDSIKSCVQMTKLSKSLYNLLSSAVADFDVQFQLVVEVWGYCWLSVR